ncbi:uncharacterized protein LOC132258497 [Phlebotomus argentipes]|uniref:uncharacterized protein LOC132258497 n=1 Tax=Phlebotomus argentipes TaxID=94469 RepID=UPI002893669F|nr:uncharacterized protein LOC132258497 [Phlebotomus argentipes]
MEERLQSRAEGGQNLISSNLLGGIMRMMGLDSGKLGALVINGLIFIAQMVKNGTKYLTTVAKDWKVTYEKGDKQKEDKLTTTGFTGVSVYIKSQSRKNPFPIGKSLAARMFPAASPLTDPPTQPPMGNYHPAEDSQASESIRQHEFRSTDEPKVSVTEESTRSGSPLDWILTNSSPHLNRLMMDARHSNLPQRLVELVAAGQSGWTEGECILRLLCKTSPFVWAMQRAIGDRIDGPAEDNQTENEGILDTIMKHLPDGKEVDLHGDACEERYPNCRVYT